MTMLKQLVLPLLLAVSPLSSAAPLTWETKSYSHFSDQEPLSDMLQTLAAVEHTPIVVSPKVKEVVSLHYKQRAPLDIFKDLAKTYGLIWFFDGETLYVYKESEAQRGTVSLKKMSPEEFTSALKRLKMLDEQYHWEVSAVDNVIYFTGPERFVSSVLDMAKLMDDTNRKGRTQVYKWTDSKGQIHYSNERPVDAVDSKKDVSTKDRFPGFDVVDIIDR